MPKLRFDEGSVEIGELLLGTTRDRATVRVRTRSIMCKKARGAPAARPVPVQPAPPINSQP
jgi:hypothetical protein